MNCRPIKNSATACRSRHAFIRQRARRKPSRPTNLASDYNERLQAKLREGSFVLFGFPLAAILLLGSGVIKYYRSEPVDSMHWILTAILIIFVIPLTFGETWQERRILQEKLSRQNKTCSIRKGECP